MLSSPGNQQRMRIVSIIGRKRASHDREAWRHGMRNGPAATRHQRHFYLLRACARAGGWRRRHRRARNASRRHRRLCEALRKSRLSAAFKCAYRPARASLLASSLDAPACCRRRRASDRRRRAWAASSAASENGGEGGGAQPNEGIARARRQMRFPRVSFSDDGNARKTKEIIWHGLAAVGAFFHPTGQAEIAASYRRGSCCRKA